uniref:Uncharacterized protein n=1 Tax=Ananas comosus var. bracteatus TaxID=296719 RepID=A0A6V7QPR7_ANACO|nr:unnamed protein product [Ananas comosus var. bracteatus]
MEGVEEEGGGDGRWRWWAGASSAQLAGGIAWYRRGCGESGAAMPFKAFAIATLFVGAAAAAAASAVVASGVHSISGRVGSRSCVGSSSSSTSNSRGSSSSRPRDESGGSVAATTLLRKGPWMAEEDEILLEYVRSHGPRDWSSIRSKGLLPRTGKSCRLRWVNKLKPDLKTGCKFSAEEERVVIELQAQLGNKWARIATYLPGRTDNDVKNFWSTRQKRLARILRTPLPTARSSKTHGAKAPLPNSHDHLQTFKVSSAGYTPLPKYSKSIHFPNHTPRIIKPKLSQLGNNLTHDRTRNRERIHLIEIYAALANPFDHLHYPLIDLPALPDTPDLVSGFDIDMNSIDDLTCQGDQLHHVEALSPFFGLESGDHAVKTEHWMPSDIFFDDLPPDMFDSLEPPPPPASSSSPW